VFKEKNYLNEVIDPEILMDPLTDDLLRINKILWVVEDKIRDLERQQRFDDRFIALARDVYITNDERARIKKEINIKYGSDFVEEKSYQPY
jgi:hypothetical protein